MISLEFNPQNRFAGIADETKLILAISFSVLVLLANIVLVQLAMLFFLLVLAVIGGVAIKYILKFLSVFLPVILIIFLLHLFYHKGQVLFSVWFFKATDVGLYLGFLNLLRFVDFIMIAICFFSFASPLNVSTKLATFFGLAKGRFFQELALVFFIALRFLPVLARERKNLMLAMRARGIALNVGLISRLRLNVLMLLPLLSRAISQSDDVAAALSLKGDGATYFVPERSSLRIIDIIIIFTGIALTIAAICYA
jgi:energy-coupling factor transport system permease protein